MAATYQFPIGKGRALNLNSRLANTLLGGWVLNGVYTRQTGQPILWANGSTTSPGDYVFFGGPDSLIVNAHNTNSPAFNTALFATNSTQTFSYHIRTFSTTFPNLRQDGINQLDMSLLKSFLFTESSYLQLRLETFNLANHPEFAAPSTTATNPGFGLATAQANRSRQLQIGARLVF
jgi:hypothetical protein